jgi:hypothetical protein
MSVRIDEKTLARLPPAEDPAVHSPPPTRVGSSSGEHALPPQTPERQAEARMERDGRLWLHPSEELPEGTGTEGSGAPVVLAFGIGKRAASAGLEPLERPAAAGARRTLLPVG